MERKADETRLLLRRQVLRRPSVTRWVALAAFSFSAGCASLATESPRSAAPAYPAAGRPLVAARLLVPAPSDDETPLGRVVLAVPENGQALDDVLRPNDCADKLAPREEEVVSETFEDAQPLAVGGGDRAGLATFAFSADAAQATHIYYRIAAKRRVTRAGTEQYLACCKEKGSCGYGFVSELVYGTGEYATAAQSDLPGSVSLPVTDEPRGVIGARVLHKHHLRGYIAARVTVTDPQASRVVGLLGDPAATRIEPDNVVLPEPLKSRFEAARIRIVDRGQVPGSSTPAELDYRLADARGEVAESEFADRYWRVTGSDELVDVKPGDTGLVVMGANPIALGVGMVLAVALSHDNVCSPFGQSNGHPTTRGLGAGRAFTAMGAALAWSAQGSSRGPIRSSDAVGYVTRYNRALLRQILNGTAPSFSDADRPRTF